MDDQRRQDDIVIAELNQKFNDFIDRYERDWEYTQEWRKQHDLLIGQNSEFIAEFKPIYRRVLLIIGLVLTASIGVAIKDFWQHIGWR